MNTIFNEKFNVKVIIVNFTFNYFLFRPHC